MHGNSELQKFVQQKFLETQANNPHFSLRSYAKKLAISPAALSEILHGKRRVSATMAEKILTRAGASAGEHEFVLAAFTEKSDRQGATAQPRYTDLELDQFNVMADWHYFAILSLAKTVDFSPESENIATRLGLKVPVVVEAIGRLKRLGLLLGDELKPTNRALSVHESLDVLASEKQNRQSLQMAEAIMGTVPGSACEFGALTFAASEASLNAIKKRLKSLVDEVRGSEATASGLEVYQLGFQLFPLTKR